jgi:hypothetical protein
MHRQTIAAALPVGLSILIAKLTGLGILRQN